MPDFTERQMRSWGMRFAGQLPPGSVVALDGELGAGKTTLAQALCRGFGVVDDVTSPTFSLIQTYQSPVGPVHHLDLYRIERPGDVDALGIDELFSEARAVLIEWAERAGDRLPEDTVHLRLAHVPGHPDLRRVEQS